MPGLKTAVDLLYNAVLNGPAVQLTRYPVNGAGQALTASGMTTGAFKYAAAGANQVQVTGLTGAGNTAGVWIAGGAIYTINLLTAATWVMWIGRGTIPAAVRAAELQWTNMQDTAVGHIPLDAQFLPLPIFVRAGVGVAMDLATDTVAGDYTANGQVFVYTGLGS